MMLTPIRRNFNLSFPALLIILFMLAFVQHCQKFEPQTLLVLSTGEVEPLAGRQYKMKGTIVNSGKDGVTQHGFCWSENRNPTIESDSIQLGAKAAAGIFSSNLSDFMPGATYYIRSYAIDASGTKYGKEKSFQTDAATSPVLSTANITLPTENSAEGGGEVTDDGGLQITARGVCWSKSENPTIAGGHTTDGSGSGAYSSSLTGLECSTTYYVRAYATNSAGTSYGTQVNFTTSECPAGLPEVSTSAITSIDENSAQGGGNVTNVGTSTVTTRGICWNTTQDPDIETGSFTTDGTGSGLYNSPLTGLGCNTTYFVRAYATNSAGTSYGTQVEFTTTECPAGLPEVSTSAISSIDETSAQGGGIVTDEGASSVIARGVVWSSSPNPDIETGKVSTDGTGTGAYNSNLTNLDCNTKYYVRAYATNASGTSYGLQVEFVTSECPPGYPAVSTSSISGITDVSADGGGEVTDEGGASVSARGLCWSTSQDPDIETGSITNDGSGSGQFISSLTGLECNTRYYVRAYATNSTGTAYGAQVGFTTSVCPVYLPTVTTSSISNVAIYTADGGGEVTADGGASITAMGICWDTSNDPEITDYKTTDGSSVGVFTSSMTGLNPSTTYYVRAYATNSEGTAYGDEESFITFDDNTVTDIEGNVYNILTIGTQVWMAENLKVTKFPDGSSIPYVEAHVDFEALGPTEPTYNWYDNDISYKEVYGALYTWAAAMNGADGVNAVPSGVQGVCPDGWHLPSDNEWKVLEGYLGMSTEDQDITGSYRGTIEGGMLKEAGTDHWDSPNTDATNLTSFTALPGGQRHHTDDYTSLGSYANFWTSTDVAPWRAHRRVLSVVSGGIHRGDAGKDIARSVRCMKN